MLILCVLNVILNSLKFDKMFLFIQIKVEIEEFIKTVFALFQGTLKIFDKLMLYYISEDKFLSMKSEVNFLIFLCARPGLHFP